jgi:HAD superfamily hydrolase (TIGR01549 family)
VTFAATQGKLIQKMLIRTLDRDLKMIKAVSLDFDWTIAEMRPQTYSIFHEVLHQFGHTFDLETIKQKFADTIDDLSDVFQEKVLDYARFSPEEQWSLLRAFNRLRLQRLGINAEQGLKTCLEAIEQQIRLQQKRVLYEDVQETLEQLSARNIELYIISGNTSSRIEATLHQNGVFEFFKEILTPDNCDMLKRDIYQLLLEKTGFLPEMILHCGDHEQDDVAAADAHGLKAVLIRRSSHYYQKIANDSFPVIQTLDEILKFL